MRILTLLAASALVLTAFPAMAQDLTAKATALRVVAGESDTGAGVIWNLSLPKGSLDHPAMQAFQRAAFIYTVADSDIDFRKLAAGAQ